MRTPALVKYTGIKYHLANMEVGEGKFRHQYLSMSKKTEEVFGYKQVLLTVKTDNPNKRSLIRELNREFNGAGFQPW